MPHYLTQAEAERAVGGAHELKQLMPKPGYSTVDFELLEDCLYATDGEIRKWIGMTMELDAFDALYFDMAINDTPRPLRPMSQEDRALVRAAAQQIFAFFAWDRGAKKLAMPSSAAYGKKDAGETLKGIGLRAATLGSAKKVASGRGHRTKASQGVGEYSGRGVFGRWRRFV